MKKLTFIVFLLSTGTVHLSGQNISSILGYSGIDYNYNKITIRNTPLFNKEEIKNRGIKACCIIHRALNWKSETIQTDTLAIFNFNPDGNIEREIRFGTWYINNRDTIDAGHSYSRNFAKKIDSTVSVLNGQTIVTTYYIWAFNWENTIEDTGYIKKEIYDNKHRLTEFKHNGTTDYHTIYFCGTGITFHDKYKYDNKNNIIFYQDVYSRQWATFGYHKNSRVVRVYDSQTKKLKIKYRVHVDINDETIIEKEESITTISRLSKNSKLFNFISVRPGSNSYGSDEYIILYEYFDKQINEQGKEKLFVTN
jgi:hypothetical protein